MNLIGRKHFRIKMWRKIDTFNKTILNILSSSILHETIICNDRNPTWFNNKMKSLIHKKTQHLESFAETEIIVL